MSFQPNTLAGDQYPIPSFFDVTAYGAKGDGVTDDSSAIQAAMNAAAVASTLGTVYMPPRPYVIGTGLICAANLQATGAVLNYTGSNTGTALTLGTTSSSSVVSGLTCWLPSITCVTKDWTHASIGVKCANLQSSEIHTAKILQFTYAWRMAGNGPHGCVYNKVFIGSFEDNLVGAHHLNDTIDGWCNSNDYHGGRIIIYSASGTAIAGSRAVKLDCFAGLSNQVNEVHFYDVSWEDSGQYEYQIELVGATDCSFMNCRWEESSGSPKIYNNETVTTGYYSQKNLVFGGYNVASIVQTASTNSQVATIFHAKRLQMVGSTTLILENAGSSTSSSLVIMAAGDLEAGASPSTAWEFFAAAELFQMKANSDTTGRLVLNPFLTGGQGAGFGGGGSTPTVYVGRQSSTGYPALSMNTGTNWLPLAADAFSLLTYSASITPDLNVGSRFQIIPTNTTPFTINAIANPRTGATVWFDIGQLTGVMGTVTFAPGAYKLSGGAFTNPASTKRKTLGFYYDGSFWVQLGPASADI